MRDEQPVCPHCGRGVCVGCPPTDSKSEDPAAAWARRATKAEQDLARIIRDANASNRILGDECERQRERAEKAERENESLRAECGLRQIQGYNEGKAAAESKLAAIERDAARMRKLLVKIANWDMMGQAADGPYWLREIGAAIAAEEKSNAER